MRNWKDTTGTLEGDCPWYDDHLFAELVAKRLDIPFHMIDLSDEYRRRVVDYMFAEYARAHAQSGRAVQPRDQVRRLSECGSRAGRRFRGDRPLLPPRGDRGRRSDDSSPACGQRPEQGPELFPLPAFAATAFARALSDRTSAQARGPAHRYGTASGYGCPQGLSGHLFRGQGAICPFSCSSSSQPRTATSSRSRPDGRVIVRCLRTLRSGGWPSLSATNLRTARAWDVIGALTSSRSDSARA